MWQRAWWPPFNTVHWVTNLRSVSIQTANLNSNFYYMHVPWYGVIFIVEFIKCLLRASIKNTKTLSLSLFDMRAWRDPLPPQIWRSITLTLLNASKPSLCRQAVDKQHETFIWIQEQEKVSWFQSLNELIQRLKSKMFSCQNWFKNNEQDLGSTAFELHFQRQWNIYFLI